MFANLIRVVGDRQAGFALCLIVVLNLIVGSLVMNFNPDVYPSFFNLDLNFFFQPVRAVHFWLYALLVTFSLFGINLIACTVDSAIRLMSMKTGRLKPGAALLFHAALIVTLFAHLFEGFYASTDRSMISTNGADLPVLGRVQVESLENIYWPDDSLQDTEVKLSFRTPDGQQINREIAYNKPAIFDGGRRQVVMLNGQTRPGGVVITRSRDNQEFRMEPGRPQSVGSSRLVLQGLFKTETGVPYAQFYSQSADVGVRPHMMLLAPGQPHSKIDLGSELYEFKDIIESPFIVAIVRYNPAIPLIVVSLLLASAGLFMMIKWMRTRNSLAV